MPKGKIKKSVKRNASKQMERILSQEEINSTYRKDESANPSIDNSCLNESINTSNLQVHCTVSVRCKASSSNKNQDDSSGSPENGVLLTESSTNTDFNNDFDCASGFGQCDESISVPSENVCSPSVPTPEQKFQKRNKTFGDIERVLTHFDDIIIAAASVAEHDAILKQVLDKVQANNVDNDKDSTSTEEIPDQSLTITEKVRLWAAKHNVKQNAASSLLNILKRFHPEGF